MFDVGMGELVLIFVIGLLVLGPERLPKVASQVGRWVGRARRTAAQLRHQLEREIALNEITETQRRRAAPSRPAAAPAAAQEQGSAPAATAAEDSASELGAASASAAAPGADAGASEGIERPAPAGARPDDPPPLG